MGENMTVKAPTINGSLTRKVIELHNNGYEFDFQISDRHEMICLQNNMHFPVEYINVEVIGQGYDLFSRSFKYIHIIETTCGAKGIFLAEQIYNSPS